MTDSLFPKASMAGHGLKGRERKKAAPVEQGGKTLRVYITLLAYLSLLLAVMGGVVTARLDMVMLGVAGMTVRGMGVMRRLFVVAGFMMLRRLAVMFRGMLVMLGGLVVMLDVGVFAHGALPVYG